MKKIRIFSDFPLVFGSVLILITNSILCIWMMVITPSYALPSDVFLIRCLWLAVLILFYAGMVIASKRILTAVTFDRNVISFWAPFMRSQRYEYKRYSHIYPASYFHGTLLGFGSRVSYVVFSQKYLSDEMLMNINHLANSPEVFKIRMCSRTYNELLNLLPPYQAKMLQSAWDNRSKNPKG